MQINHSSNRTISLGTHDKGRGPIAVLISSNSFWHVVPTQSHLVMKTWKEYQIYGSMHKQTNEWCILHTVQNDGTCEDEAIAHSDWTEVFGMIKDLPCEGQQLWVCRKQSMCGSCHCLQSHVPIQRKQNNHSILQLVTPTPAHWTKQAAENSAHTRSAYIIILTQWCLLPLEHTSLNQWCSSGDSSRF